MDQIIEIHKICYLQNFHFQSLMAAKKFYDGGYALKSNDKKFILEDYEQHVAVVSLSLAQGNFERAKNYAHYIVSQQYQPATPTFMNAGRARRGELVSCFLTMMDDSLNSINHVQSMAAQLSKLGGGVAINLTRLRARGESIKGVKDVAKGVVPVAKLLQDEFAYADQLGQRAGAGAAYLNIFHWDVEEFLDTKKENADENIRLATLSIGLIVPDKFMQLAAENKDFYMFSPYSIYKKYGKQLDDMKMDEWYGHLINDPDIRKKKRNAREFLNYIAQIQMQSGYPYIFYKDNANAKNPLHALGEIKMSNLCTEIFQNQEVSVISDYGNEDDIHNDVSCNLGSLNIVNVMEAKDIENVVTSSMRMLSAVSDMTDIKNAPSVAEANRKLHSVGLGAMNLNGFLANNKIGYESVEARDFADTFFGIVNFYSIQASMKIAREKLQKFDGFDKSDYANGKYFEPYIKNGILIPTSEKLQRVFEGIHIPTKEEWKNLAQDVARYGLYNAYRMAIAPTQSISYIQNATQSVLPIVEQIEHRKYGDLDMLYPMPYLSPETMWYYKSAYHTNQFRVMDMIARIQKHVDQGISTILYVDSHTSTRNIARYYVYAHHKGLKSLYYTRTNILNPDECEACGI
jgi:ribonucleoside-diphosphate reductase alpha chain